MNRVPHLDRIEPVRVRGIIRADDDEKFVSVALSRRPTDDELRQLHEYLRKFSPKEKVSV